MESLKDREKLLKDIIKTRASIRKKFRALKTGRADTETQLKRMFNPVTKPLEELATNIKQQSDKQEIKNEKPNEDETFERALTRPAFTSTPLKSKDMKLEEEQQQSAYASMIEKSATQSQSKLLIDNDLNSSENLAIRYIREYLRNGPQIDNVYGPRTEDGSNWTMGNSEMIIEKDKFIINGKPYEITVGLCELLFMKKPIRLYSIQDASRYGAILKDTHAYRLGYEPEGRIIGNRGDKYKEIIRNLINDHSTGGGLKMMLPKANIDQVYWDDPNELVDRLRLLIASQRAGNNSHHNEIISIIEELREAGIIV